LTNFDEACAIVANLSALGAELVPLLAAEGRTLAEHIVAPEDVVPYARSAMDGFAVRADDTRGAPLTLPIAAAPVYAEAGLTLHAPHTATAIATGGAIPAGADAVIPFEDVFVSAGAIVVARPVHAGHHVFPPGEDARAGDELAAPGTLLDPPTLALLGSAGITTVVAFRLPRVAVVTTGNELVPFDATPAHGQIRNSNAIAIGTSLRAFGAGALDLRTVADDRDALRSALASAFASADLTVVSGGASVGERDYVKSVCDELGVTFAFRSVALRPARPSAFGRYGDAHVALLPGNPAAAFVALHEFVRPAVAALGGRFGGVMPRVSALLDGTLHARRGRTFAVYSRLRFNGREFVATPLANQCSALTRLAADADGFAIVPPDADDLHPGAHVDVDVVSWRRVHSHVPRPARSR